MKINKYYYHCLLNINMIALNGMEAETRYKVASGFKEKKVLKINKLIDFILAWKWQHKKLKTKEVFKCQ